jgi:hypothetical protein
MIPTVGSGLARRVGCVVFALAVGGFLSGAVRADATRTVVAGPQYKASGSHEFILGHDYRNLWTTPITVEVLDMQKEAEGLTAGFRVGGHQTKGLALKGKDGKNYTFRGLQKDNSEAFGLSEDLRGTIVEKLIDDQAAAQHPGSELAARGLLGAAGIPAPAWRMVVLPDDAALGEFRKDFAGEVGYFAEYPSAVSATNPGFRGITEIIDHAEMYKRLEAGTGDRVDTRALLKARLVDIVIGDWDRHRKQWRWAKMPGSPLWQPIPEDRDQAFSRYEGVLLSIGRSRDARFQNFGPKYSKIGGLTWNGWEQDRRLFAGMERRVFDEEAAAVKAALTDDAIDKAVSLLPPEWQKLDGARLAADLKARRDALPEIAGKFYRHLADRVDVYMTNQPELAEAKRSPDGDVEVTVAPLGADGQAGEPSFHRVFHKSETDEVRFYALGGDDKVVVTGGKGSIKLRAIGGPGNDVLDDSQGGGTELADSQGSNRVTKGPGTDEDTRMYVPPPPNKNAPWIPPRDFGSETWTIPWISYNSDLGFFLGWGIQSQSYRFRKDPFAAEHTVRAGWSFQESSGKLDYLGIFHRENRPSFFTLYTYVSGVDVLRYYGLGNTTTNTGDNDFFKDEGRQILLYPAMAWPLGGKRAALGFGPILRYGENKEGTNTFIDQDRPYGFGKFGQVGVRAVLAYDGRDNVQFPHKGGFVAVRGTLWPGVWDAKSTFGSVDANANAYLSAAQVVTLAVRVGGEHAFGDYPYQDAAYIGGGGLPTKALEEPRNTLRGFRSRRFGGDSSVYENTDLRLRLGRITLLVPCHVGVFGLFDVGRVFLKGESNDDTWHTSYGGGIWFSFLNYRNTFSTYIAHSEEDNIFHIGGGFTF